MRRRGWWIVVVTPGFGSSEIVRYVGPFRTKWKASLCAGHLRKGMDRAHVTRLIPYRQALDRD